MGVEANRKAVAGFFDDFSAGRIDQAFARVADDATWWVPGTLPFSGTKTKAQYLQIVAQIRNGFPEGLKLSVHAMVAENDKVAAEVESLGKHANGKLYQNKYHFLIVLKDCRFVLVKEYMDTLHLAQLIAK
ncbi:MAG: nuclear transport factor 2 family protein [Burkholderiales bacterium]